MQGFNSFRRRVFDAARCLVVLLVPLILVFSSSLSGAQTPFVPSAVDAGSFTGTSIAIDASGHAHIAYALNLGGGAFEIWYARLVGSQWPKELVASITQDPASGIAGSPSIALEPDGTPHVVYRDKPGPGADIVHAEKVGLVWVPLVIDDAGPTGGYTSIAVDPIGLAHVTYYNSLVGGELYYAAENNAFFPELVATGAAGTSNSIAISDLFGKSPRVSYFDGFDLYFAVRSPAGVWTSTLVDAALASGSGAGTSIALDARGFSHISYVDASGGVGSYDLLYATNVTGAWVSSVVDAAPIGSPGIFNDIAIDADGDPHISYNGFTSVGLRYASRTAGVWTIERISYTGGATTSLALDAHGNPQISYSSTGELLCGDAAVHVAQPDGGETWPVGSERTIQWVGQGAVNLHLSVDGGNTYDQIASAISSVAGGSYSFVVPHTPSKFCMVKVERPTPFSEEVSQAFFTIETDIGLLLLTVDRDNDGGALVSWKTNPGPADLAGYRLEKSGRSGVWSTLVALTRETSYTDDDGASGDRYRLYAINGLGEEYYMGEAGATPRLVDGISIWPVPYRSGDLHVSFATASALGGGSARAEVSVYDVAGRLVRRLVNGMYPAGVHSAVWDGRNEQGQQLATGVYFVRAVSGGEQHSRKLVIVR